MPGKSRCRQLKERSPFSLALKFQAKQIICSTRNKRAKDRRVGKVSNRPAGGTQRTLWSIVVWYCIGYYALNTIFRQNGIRELLWIVVHTKSIDE